ncbi:MAG: pantoate--beta-alanine ligase [Dehalococcoidia bacterium]|nr:pantoate--beta-alanine ligase [Dehalococcoidia bacterium]
MKIYTDINDFVEARSKISSKVALIPTMGSLHEGHVSLIKEAKNYADLLIASLFINPKQFDSSSDFSNYPRNIKNDLEIFSKNGIDIVFAPEKSDIYPENFTSIVKIENLNEILEGSFRKGHMDGVSTIVLKLLNLSKPDYAFFGEKDFQQLKLIERMIIDLSIKTEIIPVKTVRNKNGLALSSRNSLLSKEEVILAEEIYKSLLLGIDTYKNGIYDSNQIIKNIENYLLKFPEIKIEYVSIRDKCDFIELKHIDRSFALLIAVYINEVRLIDNMICDLK